MELVSPLIHWPDPLIELLGFIASFLAVGAVGFRLRVIARVLARTANAGDRRLLQDSAARAASLGLVGAVISTVLFATRLPALAARQHVTVGHMLTSSTRTQLQAAMVLAVLIGLGLAVRRVGSGWWLAAIGVIVGPLNGAFFGQWNRLVVPIHRLAGGLWIGTLFMLVIAGLGTVLRSALPSERRGAMAAELVNAFSPLALVSAGVLATFGVITAWQHLHTIAALWSTPYGVTLIVKLLVVGVVLALGAWNWRRQKPLLGSEAGAVNLRRTATHELAAAGVVLAISAILVSLPSPKPPRSAPTGARIESQHRLRSSGMSPAIPSGRPLRVHRASS
jgi:putative copper export protein